MASLTAARRWLVLLGAVALLAVSLPGCLVVPADTSQIQLIDSTTVSGYRFDVYRNSAYRCAISGSQTFVVGTKVGSSATSTAPLWVWMHGGGVGWFDSSGTPRPDSSLMTEESGSSLRGDLLNGGLLANVRNSTAGFRLLAVSYCDRDLYSGTGQADVHNPNLDANGAVHATNGLQATKAAIQFVEGLYPTSKYFLHGGSAGSAGAYYVAFAMQESGNSPAGVVGDASVANVEQGMAASQQGVCPNPAFGSAQGIIASRIDPTIADSNDEIDKLVSRHEMTVPLLHVWDHGDTNTCGNTPMQCPLPDNTVITLGATDCNHKPLADAIDAQGPSSPSENLPLCVDNDATPNCSLHVVTTHAGLTNTDPASPGNYLAAIMTWVDSRLGASSP